MIFTYVPEIYYSDLSDKFFQVPKSPNLIEFCTINIFSGFKSQWEIPLTTSSVSKTLIVRLIYSK